jgi:hypothetical protein
LRSGGLLMVHSATLRSTAPRARRRRDRGRRWSRWLGKGARRRLWRAFERAPRPAQVLFILCAALLSWLVLNWVFQVVRKPSELFFPVSGTLNKTPAETWRQYGPLFDRDSTRIMTPDFLAALAQVEASGNPVARTYWRWAWSVRPFELYRPASSAVGMYQITDGNFAEARRYCIHHHAVAEQGAWNDWHSCWFNALYTRVIPAHAVELTSAYLDHTVTDILERQKARVVTLQQAQELAAVIHLCGSGAGSAYAARGLKFLEGERCGDHEARAYVARVNAEQRVFRALAAGHERM